MNPDAWPPLPRALYSPLGPFRVTEGATDTDCFGSVDYIKREVTISSGMMPPTQIHTLMHEMVHVVLHESGVDELIDDAHQEMLCTALGMYLAGAIRSGYFTIREP